ncbi:MAG: hypothetical protein JSV62_07445 [Promethearchaeota archaeon]|nr:MAG: hypothetical protein JSV62_07445 [Candidatus Lokiarchaeota archaeon]
MDSKFHHQKKQHPSQSYYNHKNRKKLAQIAVNSWGQKTLIQYAINQLIETYEDFKECFEDDAEGVNKSALIW